MAQTLKQAILDDPEDFELPSSETNLREAFVNMAQHMAALEEQLKEAEEANQPVEKSEELEALVAKIQKAAISGIRKQMSWRLTAKEGRAKWSYDGVCSDSSAFGLLMGLDNPPTWKMKKYTKDEFVTFLGDHHRRSARYDTLSIVDKSNVNIRWNEATGEFKFSGSYGTAW
ncbi:hypothetical protein M422DRAFT_71883 [Sphaerobolus stellatus SS14]|uniref:Uncharacterized protein n=1 Tax=Sphaerobolus stellatus (strain SS14) TaxID=990650 RepID=A0A0C9UM35_SPHS4|nr:hypothetical protein M422DRAFT_71883 [Sphaerobolus stellatus SS14]